jgi:flavin-dependent dehydrogenase
MSIHFIWQPGIAQLERWGLLDKIVASNCPPITRVTMDLGTFALTGCPPPADGVAEAYCPRRRVLDKILVDAAVAAGAELRELFSVREVLREGERVTGIRGHTKGGSTVTEKARIVVGADGLHSIVARAVQAPTYHEKPALTCWYYTYWSGVPMDGVELYSRDGRTIATTPTNDGLAAIGVVWPRNDFHDFRADIEGNYLKTLELAPTLAARVRRGKREERFVGAADVPGFFRKPHGTGWALVGDAGYHKDPITAEGITDAFRDAELLAEAIDAGFSGRRPLGEALADYEQRRNEAALPIYDFTCQFATLQPPAPDMQQLFEALRANQEEANRFFGTLAGTTPIPAFFSPENTQRIIAAARRDDARP